MSVPTEKLGNLVDILSGFAFDSSDFSNHEGMPLIRIRDVVRGSTATRYSGDYDPRFIISDEDILIGMDGEFNVARWRGGSALLNQRVCRIKSRNGKLDERYLYRFLPQALRKIEDSTSYVTVKHLSTKDIREIEIPLPPVPEQKRIAAILDAAHALLEKRRKAITLTRQILQASFSDMFGDPLHATPGGASVPFRDVTSRITYGFTNPMSHLESGIPIITAKNVQDGFVDMTDVHYANKDEFDALTAKSKPRRGDILVTKDGTIGRSAIVTSESPICINQSVALIQLDEGRVTSEFVHGWLSHSNVRELLQGMQKGHALQHLQITELAKLPIPLVSIDQQHLYSDVAEAARRLTVTLEASYRQSELLIRGLQHRAFRGEL